MDSQSVASHGLMYHLIIVRPEPPGQFTAQPLGVPEIRAVAATEKGAVEQARRALADWVGSPRWVKIIFKPPQSLLWLQWAGHAKDDPDFEAYLEEIRRYRQEVEGRECSASPSTPTT